MKQWNIHFGFIQTPNLFWYLAFTIKSYLWSNVYDFYKILWCFKVCYVWNKMFKIQLLDSFFSFVYSFFHVFGQSFFFHLLAGNFIIKVTNHQFMIPCPSLLHTSKPLCAKCMVIIFLKPCILGVWALQLWIYPNVQGLCTNIQIEKNIMIHTS